MLIELTLLGSGITYWLKKRQEKKESIETTSDLVSSEQTSDTVNMMMLLKDIRDAVLVDEREQLQLEIAPALEETLEKSRQRNRKTIKLSVGATGLALLSKVFPIFTLPTILLILYLFRTMFKLALQDIKKGYYFNTFLMTGIILLALIATGQLILASLLGIIGGFFSRLINRIETNSQHHLVDVFSHHPAKVWVVREEVELQLDYAAVKLGDIVTVNAGEIIPVDGVIEFGIAEIDQHILTGESQPVKKIGGDSVFASTLLLSGRIGIRVDKSGEDSIAAQVGHILNSTQSYKDSQMSRGREIANRFIPVTLGLSAVTLSLLGAKSAVAILSAGLGSSMAFLGSMSVLSYLQILSRNSILVKDGRVFEFLREVDTVIFDKTGTLTLEQPTLGKIYPFGEYSETAVLRYAAAAEYRQSHPIAKAILAKAEQAHLKLPEIENTSYETGYGIKGKVEGLLIRVGSARFLQRDGVDLPDTQQIEQQAESDGYSLIYVSINQHLAGILEIQPTLRPEAHQVIAYLKQRGLKLYIISGDHEEPTRKMADTLGIEHYFSETLPENKARLVTKLRNEGRFVCFIGDGINDSIALKTAQVSISIKGASSAATDTAQIIFMDGTLNRLKQLFELEDSFETTMETNLITSFAPGIITISGVYLFNFGFATGLSLFYLGFLAGIGNVFLPLAEHQLKTQNPVDN